METETRMLDTCNATTKRGTQCQAKPMAGSPFCALHANPGRAAELGRKGGLGNRHYVETAEAIAPPSTPEEIKNVLSRAMADVHAGKLHPRIAHTLTYLAGTLLKSMEGTELQHRLARIEAQLRNPDGHSEQAAADASLVQSGTVKAEPA